MKTLAPLALVALVPAFVSGCVAENEDFPSGFPEPAAPTVEHAWLQQLVGEWTVKIDSTQPGALPLEASENVRSIGGLWVVGDGEASEGDRLRLSMITLGYDPSQSAFVGTWIDTSAPNMWIYRGTLDETRKVLTLEATGPGAVPGKTALYRDAIEIKSADQRVLTSSMQQEDGSWMTFMRAEYHRKQ